MRAHTTTKPTTRRHLMWQYLFYLAAVVLPGGALLILIQRLWLRLHM